MRTIAVAAALIGVAAPTLAIVVVDPGEYIARPLNAHVARLPGGTCVPIGARYAVTADHVTARIDGTIVLEGRPFRIKNIFHHPNAPTTDLKVIEIVGPPFFYDWVAVHPEPTSIQDGTPVYIGGHGKTAGQVDGDCIGWSGRGERWAKNRLSGTFGNIAYYRFDIESPNEGIASVFDSGSFLGVRDADQCRMSLLGIAISATTSLGPTCDGHFANYLLLDDPWIEQFIGPTCGGDLDTDGDTDIHDFSILANAISYPYTQCVSRAQGDLNRDGIVNIEDFTVFAADFGCTP